MDISESEKHITSTELASIRIICKQPIYINKQGFVGDDAQFCLISLHNLREVRCTFGIKRQILTGKRITWISRRSVPIRYSDQNHNNAIKRTWYCSIQNVDSPAEFYDLDIKTPNPIPIGAKYTLVIRIDGYEECYHDIYIVKDDQLTRPTSGSFLHNQPIIPIVDRDHQQCVHCGVIITDSEQAMSHLKTHNNITERDMFILPLIKHFVNVSSDAKPVPKTRECPNHMSYSNGPYACKSYFPYCNFIPVAQDNTDWKQMLDHIQSDHIGKNGYKGIKCMMCDQPNLITYKDMKTHAKTTKHFEFSGVPISKHQFLMRSTFKAPFLCNCDGRTSQNWHLEQTSLFTLSQPKIKAKIKAKTQPPQRVSGPNWSEPYNIKPKWMDTKY